MEEIEEQREHELTADCWCGPRIEHVPGTTPTPGDEPATSSVADPTRLYVTYETGAVREAEAYKDAAILSRNIWKARAEEAEATIASLRTRLAEAERWGNDMEEQRDYWIEQESHAVTAFRAQEARAERAEAALRHVLVVWRTCKMAAHAGFTPDTLMGSAIEDARRALEQGDEDG